MLIDFNYLWHKYNIDATGVLHVGAHTGEEAEAYYKNGIQRSIWIEANPDLLHRLQLHLLKFPEAHIFNTIISDKNENEVNFYLSSNDGQSSSILQLGTHKIAHPDVRYTGKKILAAVRLDFLFDSLKNYTFVNIDIQGAELMAIKGMGDLIDDVKYFYLEVNKDHLYKKCALVTEIDEYLGDFDFKRVETHWAGNTGWGDAFYIKQNG